MVFRRPIYNKVLTDTEYKTYYRKLNTPDSLIKYIDKGCFMMRVNNKLIETHNELKEYNKREQQGEKFFYSLEFIPLKYLNIFQFKKNKFKVSLKSEISEEELKNRYYE